MAQTGWLQFGQEEPSQGACSQVSVVLTSVGLRALLHSTLDGIVLIDRTGVLHCASRVAQQLLGLDPIQQGKVCLEELVPLAARQALKTWQMTACAVSENSSAPPFEVAIPGADLVCLTSRGPLPVQPGFKQLWVLGVQDAADRHTRAESLEHLKAELVMVLNSMESGGLLLDGRGGIRFANERFIQLIGLDPQRWAGLQTLDDILEVLSASLRDSQQVLSLWRRSFTRGQPAAWEEIELVRPTHRVMQRFARPVLDAANGRIGWLEILRDVTGQRMLQSKLLQTEKMAALGRLVSGVAHELNNPLTSIMGYAQLLPCRRDDAERLADSRRISQEADRAGRIVRNLLLFAREAKPERRPVNINEIIERTIALRSYDLNLQGIAVGFEPDPHLAPTLADPTQLQQVVLNLLVNAEQALQESNRTGTIRIRTQQLSPDHLLLEVSDDGPGIPADVISRIFDPFFTTKPVGVGTGLGLSIVYGIVQEHGGEISVVSMPGSGATFTVEFPAVSTHVESAAANLPLTVVTTRHATVLPVNRHRLLVVEDEPTVAQLIADVLTEEGHEIEIVLDSREALERIKFHDFDLIICDLRMPGLDGKALHRELLRDFHPVARRILFVTGDVLAPQTMLFLEESGLPFLAKPFLIEELKLAVKRCLDRSPGRNGPVDRIESVARRTSARKQ